MEIDWDHELVARIISRGIAKGLERGFPVACAVVDAAGRERGVIRHHEAGFMTAEFATGKARLASSTKTSTGATFERLQRERPLYGATLAALNGPKNWFLAEGGAPVMIERDGKKRCVGAIGVSGGFPATVDQEIADELVAWLLEDEIR